MVEAENVHIHNIQYRETKERKTKKIFARKMGQKRDYQNGTR